jgi:hypothetical protein
LTKVYGPYNTQAALEMLIKSTLMNICEAHHIFQLLIHYLASFTAKSPKEPAAIPGL